MKLRPKNPWKGFKTIGDLRLARGEDSEGGWGTLLLLNLLAGVVGWLLGLYFHVSSLIEAMRDSRYGKPLDPETWSIFFWVDGCGGAIVCMVIVTVLWIRGGRPSDKL